jgi:hypothetical protein
MAFAPKLMLAGAKRPNHHPRAFVFAQWFHLKLQKLLPRVPHAGQIIIITHKHEDTQIIMLLAEQTIFFPLSKLISTTANKNEILQKSSESRRYIRSRMVAVLAELQDAESTYVWLARDSMVFTRASVRRKVQAVFIAVYIYMIGSSFPGILEPAFFKFLLLHHDGF